MDAMQYVLIGKVPVNLISPIVLWEIWKNVTLILPEGNELVASIKLQCMYWYYEIVEAVMLADLHSFVLILYVPLKTVKRHFELFKIVALPARIF